MDYSESELRMRRLEKANRGLRALALGAVVLSTATTVFSVRTRVEAQSESVRTFKLRNLSLQTRTVTREES